jgi:hypothetical protein
MYRTRIKHLVGPINMGLVIQDQEYLLLEKLVQDKGAQYFLPTGFCQNPNDIDKENLKCWSSKKIFCLVLEHEPSVITSNRNNATTIWTPFWPTVPFRGFAERDRRKFCDLLVYRRYLLDSLNECSNEDIAHMGLNLSCQLQEHPEIFFNCFCSWNLLNENLFRRWLPKEEF